MQQLKNKMIALGVVVALGAIGILMNPNKAVGQGPPGGLAVNLVNPLPVPVRTVSESFQPVSATGNCGGLAVNPICNANLYTVPAGKRLVIEYFSASANFPAVGDNARLTLDAGPGNVVYLPHLPPATGSPFGGGFTTGGQTVKLYAGPLATIQASGLRNASSIGIFSFNFAISGYLVNE
jgi:hypothetical protein